MGDYIHVFPIGLITVDFYWLDSDSWLVKNGDI